MPPTTKPELPANRQVVKFNAWHNGYRAGDLAGFTPEEAQQLVALGVAEIYLTEEQRGKAEAAARKAAAEAEKEAKRLEDEAKAKAEADEKARLEAEKKAKGGA